MREQNFVLITHQGRVPVMKKPMQANFAGLIKRLDDCLERTDAEKEIRTVCIIDEAGEFDAWAEKPFRSIFNTK